MEMFSFSMTPNQVATLSVRLGDHNIKMDGDTQIYETKVTRVVRHKGFSQQTLVGQLIVS
jgi:hypothetical protein